MSITRQLPPPGDESGGPGFAYSPIRDGPPGDDKGGDKDVEGAERQAEKSRRECSRWLYRWRYPLWFLLILAVYVLYITIFNLGWTGYGKWWTYTDSSSPALSDADPSAKTVVLIGDSLVNRPFRKFGSGGMIRRRIPEYPLVIWNAGEDGSKIASTYNRLPAALAHNPNAVILLWDSDASDVDESLLTEEQVTELRGNYTETLRLVVNATLAWPSVEYFAMAGPCVYGSEGPLFKPRRFWDKNSVFDEYRDLNRQVASEFGVDYIDVRTELTNAVPFYWSFYKWWISIDGEHFNYRGTIIVVDLLVEKLYGWLEGKSSRR